MKSYWFRKYLEKVSYFQHHYSSLQCHMILHKSFEYADLLLNEHFSLLSILQIVVLLHILVETLSDFLSGFFDE